MTTQRNKLREDVHFRILRLLQDNPEMSQRELAKAVGLSTGGIHYVLNALIERGFVKSGNFTTSEDKRRYTYVLTPKGIAQKAALTQVFLTRKMEEYMALREEIEALTSEIDHKATPRLKPFYCLLESATQEMHRAADQKVLDG
jgi:EPS-associated MarR family transcriptional regulator